MNYTDGNTITLEHPNGSKMVGTLNVNGRYLEINSGRYQIATLEFDGFKVTKVEPAKDPLPTVPGIYVARDNAHSKLDITVVYQLCGSTWHALNGTAGGHIRAHEKLGGLVRLVPEG